MAPKQSKPMVGDEKASASDASVNRLQPDDTLSDELISQLLAEMETLTLSDLDMMEGYVAEDKLKIEQSLTAKKKQLSMLSSRRSELEKPLKEEQKKLHAKQVASAKKAEGKEERDRIIILIIFYKGSRYEVEIKRGKTTGKLRELLVELWGLKKSQRLIMLYNDRDIYLSGKDNNSFGLKRLHVLGLDNGSVINITLPTAGTDDGDEDDDEMTLPLGRRNLDDDISDSEDEDELSEKEDA
eukprot:Skav225613  [mRNA]  locus=scaffold89:268140:268862:- [translate_table: standard]